MARAINLTGRRFGRLTAIERVASPKAQAQWRCVCDCGKETVVRSQDLRNGHTKSCGCYGLEVSVSHTPSFSTHKESKSRLYRVWIGMKARCNNCKNKAYSNYGGRGINVCQEWDASYEAFREWALANGYDENAPRGRCTIDRINVNGNYCPENCRWVDVKTQMNNTRANRRITQNGETRTMAEWAERTGIAYETIRYRATSGKPADDVLCPPQKRREKCGNKNETTTG